MSTNHRFALVTGEDGFKVRGVTSGFVPGDEEDIGFSLFRKDADDTPCEVRPLCGISWVID